MRHSTGRKEILMHMADALISPAVGGTLWAASAGLIAYSSRKIKQDMDDRRIPLMGVLGAFIFSAQMINFTIPGTGSSGHLGGGMILAILLASRLSHPCLRAHGAGSFFWGRMPSGPGMQHVQPRILPLLCRLSSHLQTDRER
jgi:hypothetical protein